VAVNFEILMHWNVERAMLFVQAFTIATLCVPGVTDTSDCQKKDTSVCNFLLSGLSFNTIEYMQKSPRYQKRRLFFF